MAIVFRGSVVSMETASPSEPRSRGCCWDRSHGGGWRRTTSWALVPWRRMASSSLRVAPTTGTPFTSTSLQSRTRRRAKTQQRKGRCRKTDKTEIIIKREKKVIWQVFLCRHRQDLLKKHRNRCGSIPCVFSQDAGGEAWHLFSCLRGVMSC